MPARVMVVLPFYGGSLPVGHYCAAALRDNGCLVDVFEAPLFYSGMEAFKTLKVRQEHLDFLENSFLNLVGDALLAQVERFQPDLLLSMAQAPVSRKTLKRLSSSGVTTAMWFVEDYRLFTYWRAFAPLYDFFAVIQKEPFLSELRGIGVENSLYLPLAALPALHRPLSRPGANTPGHPATNEPGNALTEADCLRFGADLSFMGAGYPNRRLAFRSLAELAAKNGLDFRIWGTEWEGEPQLEKHLRMKGVRISPEEAVRIFNAAKINLNLHSSVRPEETVSQGDFVNPRTFEIASCGAFQLIDERGLLPELFAPGDLTTFGSLTELTEKIGYYLKHPEERAEIACKGRARVLAEHSYQRRMQTLLDFIREKKPGFAAELNDDENGPNQLNQSNQPGQPNQPGKPDQPDRTGRGWPEDLPPELRAQLKQLFKDLQLPANPDFESVITALRARSGKLDSLECALLFLDEWKKQYLR